MMNRPTKFMMGGIFAGLMVIAISGCKKDQQTIATITVVNADGEAVPGASVRLYAVSSQTPPPPQEVRFDTIQVTNGTGKVSFDFTDYYEEGQAGFAVLDIEASKGSLEGEGIIKIEEMKTNEETVVIE
jgi:hypothetical protein